MFGMNSKILKKYLEYFDENITIKEAKQILDRYRKEMEIKVYEVNNDNIKLSKTLNTDWL